MWYHSVMTTRYPLDRVRKYHEVRDEIVSRADEFFRGSDLFHPIIRGYIESFRARRPNMAAFSFLYYYRGLPKELVPYDVEWGGAGEEVFKEASNYTSEVAYMAILNRVTGMPVKQRNLINAVAGRGEKWLVDAVRALKKRRLGALA